MSGPEHTPLDSAEVAETLTEGEPGADPAVTDERPQDPLSRLWRMCMAPSPPPSQAGELFDPELHWSAYINSGIQGMTESGGTPAILMFAIGLAMMVAEGGTDGNEPVEREADDAAPNESKDVRDLGDALSG